MGKSQLRTAASGLRARGGPYFTQWRRQAVPTINPWPINELEGAHESPCGHLTEKKVRLIYSYDWAIRASLGLAGPRGLAGRVP